MVGTLTPTVEHFLDLDFEWNIMSIELLALFQSSFDKGNRYRETE